MKQDGNKKDQSRRCEIQQDVNLDNSTSNILIPLDSWTSGLLMYKEPLSSDPGACVGSSASNASVSPAERTRFTIGTAGESTGAGCSSSSSSSSSKGSSSGSSSSVSSSSSSSEGSSSPSPPSANKPIWRIHFHWIRRIQLSVQYSVFIQSINTAYPLPLDTAYRSTGTESES
nr:hypothetical protein [Tanacetum cinerariifolium]